MFVRSLLIILGLTALGAGVAGWGWGWREHRLLGQADFTRRRLVFLDAENRRLGELLASRQQAEEIAFAATQRAEIERTVSGLRSLPFVQPVVYREIPRAQLPDILRQKLAQQVPDREFGAAAAGLGALGLVPRGLDLKKTYLALLGEQIGAFYDQHTQELFTFSGQSLANAQNRVILAHELTHALEDQHFNLSRLPLEARGNDDRVLAASALVEGDATLVMNQYMVGNLSAAVIRDSLATALTTDVRQLAAAPRYLRETLLFPYLHGLQFCQTLYDHGGWDALAAAFRHPPASTAQILHPDRFLAEYRQEPTDVQFDQTTVLGMNPLDDNVLGEFGIQQMLFVWLKDNQTAAAAAEGWRGDRYLVYSDAATNSYVWQTCWEDASSATRFSDALKRCLVTRYKDLVPAESGAAEGIFMLSPPKSRNDTREVMVANSSPTEILLIDAQDDRWLAALRRLRLAEKASR